MDPGRRTSGSGDAAAGASAVRTAAQVDPLDEYLQRLRADAKQATGRVAREIETYAAMRAAAAAAAVQPAAHEAGITRQDSLFVETLAHEKSRKRTSKTQDVFEKNKRMRQDVEVCLKIKSNLQLEEERRQRELELARRRADEEGRLRQLQQQQRDEEQKLRDAEQQRLDAEQQQRDAALKKQAQAAQKQSDYASQQALDWAQPFIDKMGQIKPAIKSQVAADKALSNFCFKAKMKIRTRIGQVTSSMRQCMEVADALNGILNDAQAQGPIAYEWLKYVLSKGLVAQAEREVAVKRDVAFPLAHVIVIICSRHADFYVTLTAVLIKKCSYIIPQYAIKTAKMSDEEIKKAMGFKATDGVLETVIQYEERMCGVAALYFAILYTPQNGRRQPGMGNPWTWIARLLNMTPRKITPSLIYAFLEIAGHDFVQEYQGQAHKIMRFVGHQFVPKMPKESVSATTRLKLFLDEYLRNGKRISQHPGKRLS